MGTKPAAFDCVLAEILGADRFRDIKVEEFPFRPGTKIGLRLLTDEETESCEIHAHAYLREQQLGVGSLAAWLAADHKQMFSARYSREVLALCLCRENGEPAVTSVGQLSKLCSRAEIDALIGLYNDYAETMAPHPSQAESEEKFDELVEALRGPFGSSVLAECRPSTLRQFAMYVAAHYDRKRPKKNATVS